MNSFIRKLSNLLYLSAVTKKKYQKEHPDEKIILCDASKAIELSEDKDPEYGKEWITARRCSVIITDKTIVAGNWTIPLDDIDVSELIKFNSLVGKGMVLKVKTKNGKHYQFGMQYNKNLEKQNALTFDSIREGKIKKSLFSKVIRILALGYILYKVLEYFVLNTP